LVGELFATAKRNQPSIIFFDQLDAICSRKDSTSVQIIKEILIHMAGLRSDNCGVFVLGATSTPWELDVNLLKNFQQKIHLGLPNLQARMNMVQIGTRNMAYRMTPEDWTKIGEMSDGYSGSDISGVLQDALHQPIREVQSADHFKKVICSPSFSLDFQVSYKIRSLLPVANFSPLVRQVTEGL
jgi:vacuolar protein-sorting-associated protein 4